MTQLKSAMARIPIAALVTPSDNQCSFSSLKWPVQQNGRGYWSHQLENLAYPFPKDEVKPFPEKQSKLRVTDNQAERKHAT